MDDDTGPRFKANKAVEVISTVLGCRWCNSGACLETRDTANQTRDRESN